MHVLRQSLALAALLAAAHAVCAATVPPELEVLLTPHTSADAIDYVGVRMRIAEPRVAAAATLVRMPLLIVSIPTARYDGQALQARDAAGNLALTQADEPPTPTGIYRRWMPVRATKGDVVLNFKAPPRVVSAQTRTGPLFDLRAEAGGASGAGISFLPVPDTKFPYRLHVHWDLSGLPTGSSAVWSLGEGDARTTAPAETLQFSYYAAGPLKRFPTTGSSAFSMYWLSPPAFDPVAVAARIQKLYAYMAEFFHDTGSSYRVFIRKNPHKAGGGTALTKSFMFGWSDASAPTVEKLQGLLAHEMTHNWPAMEGEHGATAWYSEGTAEYYSILLSYRAGVLTPAQFLSAVNERAFTYYTNPLRNLTNDEAAKRFWSDWTAQTVPYGRGFMYLASVDAKIRARSAGKRSLDGLVRTLYERQQKHQSYGIDDWLRLVTAELGPAAKEDYAAMVAGRTLVPENHSFTPCFKPEKHADRPFALGFDASSLSGEHRVIHGLLPDSPAALAGLRDGDEVVESSDLEAQKSATTLLELKLHRGEKELQVKYLPRGAPIDSYHWVCDASVVDSACKL